MLVKMKKYRQFTPKRDFGSTFTKKVEFKRELLDKNVFNQIEPGSRPSFDKLRTGRRDDIKKTFNQERLFYVYSLNV